MRTRSAARIQGDDYQHLVAWRHVVRSTLRGSGIVAVEIEAPEAGNVDDVVVCSESGPDEYHQVKWAVDASSPVGTGWLTEASAQSTSILQKLFASWRLLTGDGPPRLSLVTNRNIDPDDNAFKAFDQRSQTLVEGMRTASERSYIARARAQWAEHLEADEDELLAMLEVLRFQCGRDLASELEMAAWVMAAGGLRDDEEAIAAGVGLVRSWVADSRDRVGPDDVHAAVHHLGLYRTDPGSLLVVEAINDDPHPEDATVRLDWRGFFPGDSAYDRAGAIGPDVWEGRLPNDLQAARERLAQVGAERVVIRAKMRLPSWFAVGAEFREVAGFQVISRKHGVTHASDADRSVREELHQEVTPLGLGGDLAVVVAFSANPGDEPLRHLREHEVPVGNVAALRPETGVGPDSVGGPEAVVGLAVKVRDVVRNLVREHDPEVVHLFLVVPDVLALMLGHRWNRVRPTRVYEHLGVGRGYQPGFMVPS